ncbi:hypothetical protein ACVW00_002383 [Marmoricola sp. URHA0025 HA25]
MRQPRITFTARNPADLVALVPQVLGFHPDDSVVLMTFGRAENFHARVDLPTGEDEQLAVVAMLADVIAHHRVRQVALLLYTADPWVAAAFHDAVLARLVRDGVDVIEVLRVADDRYHDAGDVDDRGQAYDLTAHRFTAEQVVRGHVVHKSREQLAASLRFVDAEDARAVEEAASLVRDAIGFAELSRGRTGGEVVDGARWIQRTVRRQLRKGARLSADDAGRLLALTSVEELRDVALAEMTRDDAAQHVELWRDLVRRCPLPSLASASSLLAFAAWLSGQGALAWCALDRCDEVDRGYPMADRIRDLLENAVPPSAWPGIPPEDLAAFSPPDAS